MSNTIQIRDDQGNALYPITDASLIIGLENRTGMRVVPVDSLPTASADTVGVIYMVTSTQAISITKLVNGSYSWVSCGTLDDIDLSGYATKEELDQLSQELREDGLKLGFNYKTEGVGVQQKNNLTFKKGVKYSCTVTSSITDVYCGIKDSNGTTICGLNIPNGALSRTNTFTPSTDLEGAYFAFQSPGASWTLLIEPSTNIVEEVNNHEKTIVETETRLQNFGLNFYMANNAYVLPRIDGLTFKKGVTYTCVHENDYVGAYCAVFNSNGTTICGLTLVGQQLSRTNTFTPDNDIIGGYILCGDGNYSIKITASKDIRDEITEDVQEALENTVVKNGEFSDNILDDSAVILYHKFMYNYGELLDNNDYATLDFFEVKPNTQYSCSEECEKFRKVCCFDASQNFISGSGFFENVSTFTTPANCKYVRVSVPMTSVDYLMITEGVNVKMYTPYNDAQGYLNHDGFSYLLADEIKRMKMQEWSVLRFGLFIHWGVFSAWAGKYDGLDIDGNEVHTTSGTEWMWWTYKIPKETYKAKASAFSSSGWNPDKICRLAKSMGMRYVVLTVRHHEGFSLIPTPHCEWDINSSSADPDAVMQLKKACERHGLKFCVYISALLDWNDSGGFGQDRWNNGADPYTETEHLSFTDEQVAYCQQINDTYKPFLIWFDGGTYIDQPLSVRSLFIKKQTAYFPFAITNNRGSHRKGNWIEVESGYADYPDYTDPLERCNHILGWGYNESYDTPSIINNLPSILFDMMEAMGRGFNYLLNVPPKGDGTISENYVNWLTAAAEFFRKYTFFTDAKRLFNNCQPGWGRPIYRGNSIYLFILPGGSSNFYVDSIDTANLTGVYVYNIQNPESSANYEVVAEDRLLLKNVPTSSADYFPVVRLDFNGPVLSYDYNIVDSGISPMSIVVVSRKEWPTIETGVRYDTKHYMLGEGNSVSRTRFKYSGATGAKTISLTMTSSGTNNIGITVLDEDTNGEQSGTGNSISVTLTNGHIYTMTITKSGDGNCDISNIAIS